MLLLLLFLLRNLEFESIKIGCALLLSLLLFLLDKCTIFVFVCGWGGCISMYMVKRDWQKETTGATGEGGREKRTHSWQTALKNKKIMPGLVHGYVWVIKFEIVAYTLWYVDLDLWAAAGSCGSFHCPFPRFGCCLQNKSVETVLGSLPFRSRSPKVISALLAR